MGKTLLTASSSGTATVENNSNNFFPCGNTWLVRRTGTGSSTIFRAAGTISGLYVRVTANTTATDCIIRTRKNAANGTISTTIPAGTTGVFENTTQTQSVSAGDSIDYQITGSVTGFMTVNLISCIFDAPSNYVTKLTIDGQTLSTASTTNYWPLSGQVSGITATEANAQHKVKKAGTIKNLCVNVSSNARTTDTTVTMRINGADTAITVPITASTPGFFEDTTHTASVAVDDLIDFKTVTSTGTGNLVPNLMSIDYETSTQHGFIDAGALGASAELVVNSNTTNYLIAGGETRVYTTEAEAKLKSRAGVTLSFLTVWVGTNTVTADSTLNMRVNGANGNQTITIPASTTGYFHDTTHTDIVDADDEIDYQLITGATGTSMTVRQVAVWTYLRDATKTLSETDTIGESKNREKAVWRLQP